MAVTSKNNIRLASFIIILFVFSTIYFPLSQGLDDTTPPRITNISYNPRYPSVSDVIYVSARVTDESGIAWVKLTYCVGESCYANDMSGSSGLYIGNIGPFSEGQIKFQILARDTVGNTGQSPEYTINIDGTKPVVRVLSPNGGETLSGTITISWNAYDNLDGSLSTTLSYSHDTGTTWQQIQHVSGSTKDYLWNATSLSDGTNYLIRVEATDNAGNEGSDRSDYPFTIDNTPPHTSHLLDGDIGNNDWYISPVQITLQANDSLSGIQSTQYTINNGTTSQYTNPFTIETSGEYIVQYYSIDNAGNEESFHTVTFRINREKPSVTLDSPQMGSLYFGGRKIASLPFNMTIILGNIYVEITATDDTSSVTRVEFYVDDELAYSTTDYPYGWLWDDPIYFFHVLKATAYNESGNSESVELRVLIFNISSS